MILNNSRKFFKYVKLESKVMNNDMIKIDVSVSASVGLKPDLERISRAENFVEKGTIDARRD